jgi:hypothetical protein
MLARVVVILCLAAATAHASQPVKKTVTGCVVKGTFFFVDGDYSYRFSIADLDLAPFEGQTITMKGWLSPGDRFELEKDTKPTVKAKTCGPAMMRPIKRDEAVDLRLAAGREAKAGNWEKAIELSNDALAVMTPAECDSYVDRGTIFAQKGDLDSAKKDLAIVKARKPCFVLRTRKINFALLEDFAQAFIDKGDKKSGVTALELALANCDSEICRPDLKKKIAEAKKP